MSSRNVQDVRYPPEVLCYADLTTVGAAETQIKKHSLFTPRLIRLLSLSGQDITNLSLRVDADTRSDFLNLAAEALAADSLGSLESSLDLATRVDILALRSLTLKAAVSGGTPNYQSWHTLMVENPSVASKLLYTRRKSDLFTLKTEDFELIDKYNMNAQFDAGMLHKQTLASLYSKLYGEAIDVVVISKKQTVTGGTEVQVGSDIVAGPGKKLVLVEIGVTQGTAGNGTILRVDRDDQEDMLALETSCLPNINYSVPVYLPALDSFKVYLATTNTVNNFLVRYKYVVAPLTVLDKVKWEGAPGIRLTDEEDAIASAFDLPGIIKAGLPISPSGGLNGNY